jgi:hypothetical protein
MILVRLVHKKNHAYLRTICRSYERERSSSRNDSRKKLVKNLTLVSHLFVKEDLWQREKLLTKSSVDQNRLQSRVKYRRCSIQFRDDHSGVQGFTVLSFVFW